MLVGAQVLNTHHGKFKLEPTRVFHPEDVSHRLMEIEAYFLGLIFHVADEKPRESLQHNELVRQGRYGHSGRDSLRFMYENDSRTGYVMKEPQAAGKTFSVLIMSRTKDLVSDGFDFF